MADGRVELFNGVIGVAVPTRIDCAQYGQISLWIDVQGIGGGGVVDITPQISEDTLDWRGYQIIRPAVVPDQNPPTYTLRYTATGLKAVLFLPLSASHFRVDVAGAGGTVVVLGQLAFATAEGLGT